MESYTDQELWDFLRKGDRRAFEIIYHRHIRALFQEISKRIEDRDVVEDLAQDIFLSLWEKRMHYQPKGDIYPYLYGMAINRVLNFYRSNRLQPQFVEIWETMPEYIAGVQELSAAFRQAHTEEVESLLDQAIFALPDRMRQVYKLRYEENKSVPEIATLLSTSPNTVHNQLKAIRKRFLHALKNTSYFFL
ncbi:RNA polymerase sigma factor [Sphingobacterium suaedae]|uniref:RNA polymerase sigma factor n=1 Tax=Sphingobacterium suaedae TaxID=1686402 RepID=A0ABW5KGQ9_9SPHI